MKVRIRTQPKELEIDGVKLSGLVPGAIKNVSASLGSWLITQGYADPEMRNTSSDKGGTAANPRSPNLVDRRRHTS